jgi:transaldolase
MTEPAAWMVGFRWKSPLYWLMTPKPRLPRPRTCTPERNVRTFLSRFLARRKACQPSKKRSIFAGVPVNVTLLFSREHYVATAEAYLRGIERRIAAGLKPDVGSVASLFISRWDAAVMGKVPDTLSDRLGIAIGKRTYRAYCDLTASPRWKRIFNAGARPQRILFASAGTKDPKASDVLYIKELAAPLTINTMPEGTLKAFANHGEVGNRVG